MSSTTPSDPAPLPSAVSKGPFRPPGGQAQGGPAQGSPAPGGKAPGGKASGGHASSAPAPGGHAPGGHAPGGGAPPRHRRRPLSLAWRLTLTYAGSTCLLLVVAAGLMYYQLTASLKHENDAYLDEQLRDLRSDLREPLATTAAIRREVEASAPSEGDAFPTYLRILQSDGKLLAQTPGMGRTLPAELFPAVDPGDVSRTHSAVVRLPSGDRRRFQILSTAVSGGVMNTPHYVVQLALDLSEEEKLLAHYRNRASMILAPALLASVLLGYALAHGGLRPLRQIVRGVRRVQTTTLDQRLDNAGLPRELAKLADSFNAMLGRIEDAFARLSRFSADIAHELRTPLGCIRGELEVALGKARSPEEYRDVLASCLEESVRLSHLIDRLLFLARAERDGAMLRRERLDLRRELAGVSEFYEASAHEAGIALRVDAAPSNGAPPSLDSSPSFVASPSLGSSPSPNSSPVLGASLDRTLLQSALGNLIENAIAHTPRGGVITLAAAAREDGTVRIEVADTGGGIAAEHLPFVLDRFYRVDDARSRRGGHAGLGLAIVQSIAALHGGSVEVQSALGVGTRVALVLPAEPPAIPSASD